MNTEAISGAWALYGEAFRIHAHRLLAWAHSDVCDRLHSDLDEPSITGLLAEAMMARLDHPATPDAYLHYTVGDQSPVSPAGQLGNKRLRLDLSLVRAGIKPRIAFVFEAKRLRSNGFPISKYVGAGGLGDFVEGRYARDCPEAAMIGLIQDHTQPHWHRELRKSFENDRSSATPSLRVLDDLVQYVIIKEISGELCSRHNRHHGPPITVFHIFLDCRTTTALDQK
jgi:hypothetical protein